MKKITPTKPWKLQVKQLYFAALAYAGLITIATLGQLFRFDKMIDTASAERMFGGPLGVMFWCVVVVVQIFSLPYLLRMTVSPLLRYVGLVCSLLIPILWGVFVGWQLHSGSEVVGVFGAEVSNLSGVAVSVAATLVAVLLASAAVQSIGGGKLQEYLSKK